MMTPMWNQELLEPEIAEQLGPNSRTVTLSQNHEAEFDFCVTNLQVSIKLRTKHKICFW